jgi:hypothetical protein
MGIGRGGKADTKARALFELDLYYTELCTATVTIVPRIIATRWLTDAEVPASD